MIAKQIQLFKDAGLNWARSHQVVIEFIGEHTEFKSMRSQHYELFAELSRVMQPKRILEIGTSDASFSSFMSRVCPDAIVETIDLPNPKTDITHRKKI